MRLRITLLSAVALGLNAQLKKTAHPQRTPLMAAAAAARPAGLQPLAPVRPLVPLDDAAAARAARTTQGQVARAGVRREETDVEPAL